MSTYREPLVEFFVMDQEYLVPCGNKNSDSKLCVTVRPKHKGGLFGFGAETRFYIS